MPASNRRIRPRSRTTRHRQASGIRFRSSGGIHFSHIARGAFPNIAPPSSRCELPSTEVSVRTAGSYHVPRGQPTLSIAGRRELMPGAVIRSIGYHAPHMMRNALRALAVAMLVACGGTSDGVDEEHAQLVLDPPL